MNGGAAQMASESSSTRPVRLRSRVPTGATGAARCAAALVFVPLLCIAHAATAGEADVISAKVRPGVSPGAFSFDVTIRSRDRGWDYYAERFEIVGPGDTVLGTRVLLHPHEDEQPFTRELDDVAIPGPVRAVTIRAWMKSKAQLRAAGGDSVDVTLPGR
jgi:hypothetical protein